MGMARRLALPALAAGLALAVLIGLGIWQLQRKTWKEALIARLDAVAAGPAEPIAATLAAAARGEDVEFRRTAVRGAFRHRDEFHVWAPRKEGPAWSVVTPLMIDGGDGPPFAVLVIRGFVPDALKDPGRRAAGQIEGPVEVTGRVRFGAPGAFTPAPDVAGNKWMARDRDAMRRITSERLRAGGVSLPGDASTDSAPFFVEYDGAAPPGGWPRPELEPLNLRNEHLHYALTWFGIALTLVGVFVAFALREWRAPRPTGSA